MFLPPLGHLAVIDKESAVNTAHRIIEKFAFSQYTVVKSQLFAAASVPLTTLHFTKVFCKTAAEAHQLHPNPQRQQEATFPYALQSVFMSQQSAEFYGTL